MDARRRSTERDAAQGDLDAAARALRERTRAGELAPERLRLAARLGHATAAAALGEPDLALPSPDLAALASVLADAGEEVAERGALAAAWRAADHPSAPDEFRPTLARATAFTICPCARHARALLDLAPRGRPEGSSLESKDVTADLLAVASRRASVVAGLADRRDGGEPQAATLRRILEGLRSTVVDEPAPEMGFIDDFEDLARHGDRIQAWWERNHEAAAAKIAATVRADVRAWALGEGDPLAGKARLEGEDDA